MSSAQPPNPGSTIVGNCIACNGLVRVPAKANANASVRCPHCQETFPLMKLLENAVPEVEVIQQPGPTVPAPTPTPTPTPTAKPELYIDQTAETGKDASGKFVVPSQLAKGARRRKSSRSKSGRSKSRSSSSRRNESDESSQQSRGWQPYREASHGEPDQTVASDHRSEPLYDGTSHIRSRPEHARSESSQDVQQSRENRTRTSRVEDQPHRSTRHRDYRAAHGHFSGDSSGNDFLRIFAGASLALPIAYLIVMWVFVQDPLGIAEGVGSRVPFLVPSALRANADSDKTPAATDSETPDSETPDFEDIEEFSDDEDFEFEDGDSEILNIGKEALRGLNGN